MNTDLDTVSMVLEAMIAGTRHVQTKSIQGEHKLAVDGRYVGRFPDKWSTLYVEAPGESGGDWEHVYTSLSDQTRETMKKRVRSPKEIHTWNEGTGVPVVAPVVPSNPDKVTVHSHPWGIVSGVEPVLAWASQCDTSAAQPLTPILLGWGYAAAFGESDAIVCRSTGDAVPGGHHVRTTLRSLDLFMGFVSEVAEPTAEEQSVPHDDPRAVRYLCWSDPFAVYIRAEVPTLKVAVTLQCLKHKGDDPRVPLIEQIWEAPSALVVVGARSARTAIGVPTGEGRDRPVTLYADGGGFSIRSGRRKVLRADVNGEGEVAVSNRLMADALYWFLDEAVEIAMPRLPGLPVLVSQVSRDQTIMLLPWG